MCGHKPLPEDAVREAREIGLMADHGTYDIVTEVPHEASW